VNSLHDIETIHSGHLDVAEDEVDRVAIDKLKGIGPIARAGDGVPLALQNALECPPV
jgi:hypothetical protein